jgi:GT2 family glycosyltransferase
VIPVRHGGSCLAEAVASACGARPPPGKREVLVVGAGDRPAVADPLPAGARYVSDPRGSFSARLNLAVDAARGRVLAFVDDDCAVPPDHFERLVAIFDRDPDSALIGGRDELAEGASAFDHALDHFLNSRLGARGFRRPERSDSPAYAPKLWNMAIRREAAEQLARPRRDGPPALFDETLTVHQDVELADRARRAGLAVRHEPELVVAHRRETTLGKTARRNFRMGATCRRRGLQRRPHRLAVLATALLPLLLLIAVAAGIAALLRRRSPRVAALVPVVVVSIVASRAAGYVLPNRAAGDSNSRR